jgi:hypothetical protein
MRARLCLYAYACLCLYAYARLCLYAYACLCLYAYVCLYACAYVPIRTLAEVGLAHEGATKAWYPEACKVPARRWGLVAEELVERVGA